METWQEIMLTIWRFGQEYQRAHPKPARPAATPEATAGGRSGPDVPPEAAKALLDQASTALTAGDAARLASHFRYFEEPKPAAEALSQQLAFIRDRLGRPDRLEPLSSTSSHSFNLSVDSAAPNEWQRSDCVFKEYAFKTSMTLGTTRRPAEVVLDVCYGRTAKKALLRKVDFRFLEPDPKVVETMQVMIQSMLGM